MFLHKNGRLHTGPYATVEDTIITYSGGRGLTALIKLLEPLNPMLNYFEFKILKKGEECAVGIGVGSLDYLQVSIKIDIIFNELMSSFKVVYIESSLIYNMNGKWKI